MNNILQMDGEGPFDDLEGNAAFGRLFKKFLAEYGNQLLQNNEFLKAANAAGTGTVDLIKADADNNTVIKAATGGLISLLVGSTEVGSIDANGIRSVSYLLNDGAVLNYVRTATAAGTAYSLTNTSAQLDFGTTDPGLILNKAGTYLLLSRVNLKYNAATFAASRDVTLKLRRLNNTAADITGTTTTLATDIITTLTYTMGVFSLPPVIYTTTETNDAIIPFGDVSVVPSAGSLDAVEASIVAVRLY